jgi:phage replication-related protein YjqB (UPF0714/DUF867 family)
MAIHGGIEAGTAEIARALARGTGASLYVVEQPESLSWHLPSISYDPAHSVALAGFLAHVRAVVSLHGFGREDLRKTVLVGGLNSALGVDVALALRRVRGLRVVNDQKLIPSELRGRHPRNPVNLPAEAGVQLEMSAWPRMPAQRSKVIDALSEVVAGTG